MAVSPAVAPILRANDQFDNQLRRLFFDFQIIITPVFFKVKREIPARWCEGSASLETNADEPQPMGLHPLNPLDPLTQKL